jgi:NAD+ diphosphatase
MIAAVERYHPGKVLSFCPRCGRDFTFTEPNYFECESCGFKYYHGVNAAVSGIIINDKKELLMHKRAHDPAKGMLDWPGGFMAFNETAEQGLAREIKEELNLSLKSFTYFGSFPNIYLWHGLDYYTLDVVFLCVPDSFDPLKMSDEEGEAVFVKPDSSLIEKAAFQSTKRSLLQLI